MGGGRKAALAPRGIINNPRDGMPDLLVLLWPSLEPSSSQARCVSLRNGALKTKKKMRLKGNVHVCARTELLRIWER